MSGQNLFTRDDTFFGICEGIGDDFGFNANWLRLAFGVSLMLNPPLVLGVYAGLGVLVAFSRLVVRNPRPAPPAATSAAPAAQEEKQVELPLAA